MALDAAKQKYIPQHNNFYRKYYHYVIMVLMLIIVIMMAVLSLVVYQTFHRPLPLFYAIQPDGKKMSLTAFDQPNLLPETILRFASKAAVLAYTFDFANYQKQIPQARPYFTSGGWQDYLQSADAVVKSLVQNQLFVNGVVAGTPVISNQGPLPGKGYTWRVQIPFLVTYVSANSVVKRNFTVVITLVRVSTSINPQGIGIDQFVMV